MSLKTIIFDCFGVLTTDLWRAFVDSLPPEADADRARELNRQYDAGLITRTAFLEQLYEITGYKPGEVEQILDHDPTQNRTKNIKLLEYISELKKTYKIGLLSNVGTPWIRDEFLTARECRLFDDMVFSYEVGLAKPDERIFRLSLERLGAAPEQAVFIDDIESYVAAAMQIGMKGVHYQDFAQCKRDLEKIIISEM
jgi:putative hydrolase of the HAD superfamily